MISFGFWFNGNSALAVISGACAVILGTPFAIVTLIPMGMDILMREGFLKTVFWGVVGSAVSLIPSIAVDHHYYGKFVVSVFNIIFYNALSGETSSVLYGVEPWSYYFVNLFLNFNIILPLFLICIPVSFFTLLSLPKFSNKKINGKTMLVFWLVKKRESKLVRDIWLVLAGFIWLGVMLRMPHKEQRFLFVIYPLICLAAAITVHYLMSLLDMFFSIFPSFLKKLLHRRVTTLLLSLLLLSFLALSLSRIVSLNVNYGAPLRVYTHLYEEELKMGKVDFPKIHPDVPVNICVGKEWYRFPSSFFLPSKRFKYSFVKSSFGGLLPKPFIDSPNATSIIPTGMNNMNREEMDRYVRKLFYLNFRTKILP